MNKQKQTPNQEWQAVTLTKNQELEVGTEILFNGRFNAPVAQTPVIATKTAENAPEDLTAVVLPDRLTELRYQAKAYWFDRFHGSDVLATRKALVREIKIAKFAQSIGLVAVNK